MSRNDLGRFQPPPRRDPEYDGPVDRRTVAWLAQRTKQLEHDLRERDAQVRSLNAELRRLQQHVPKLVLKGERRLTRREKVAGANGCGG